MNTSTDSELKFIEDLSQFDFTSNPHGVTHILCIGGSLSFLLDHIRYNISERDYVIMTAGVFPSDFCLSEDCRVITLSFPDSMMDRETIKNNYGVIGHLSLLQDPVIKLSEDDFISCREDLIRLHDKQMKPHLFKEEVIGTLLKAHVLDLYNIHAQTHPEFTEGGRPAIMLRNFISILLQGDYKENRIVDYYADKLCVDPHYLTEVCRRFTHQPASYWINRFTIRELSSLMADPALTFDEIAFRMNFSSVSYFSRYVKKHIGITPSQFRKSLRNSR
ncbi:MAG: AraC family transcriptional regulator [Bacteroides sp.]|nr:AraC family transcriptional regulator [Bacteroides sp.]